ncbi:MAG: hypothetical protein ACO1QR_15170 [Chthoniobacteraceae bacterium]
MASELENGSAIRGCGTSSPAIEPLVRELSGWKHASVLSIAATICAALTLLTNSPAAPRDPASTNEQPTAVEGLRFVRMIRVPFRFGPIRGVRDGKVILAPELNPSFSLHPRAPNPKDGQTLTVGDHIPGTEYEITRISPKIRKNKLGIDEDVSEIVVSHIRSKKERTIVLGSVTSSEDVYAVLESDSVPKKLSVRIGSTFEFPLRSKVRYEVKEITDTHMTLVNIATGKRSNLRISSDPSGQAK